MRTPEETAKAILANDTPAADLLDDIRPLAQAYLREASINQVTRMKAFCVMCCGCGCFLQEDGSLTATSVYENGLISFIRLEGIPNNIASFDTYAECDTFAFSFNWSIRDADGTANHRCPACQARERAHRPLNIRTGAYVETSSLPQAPRRGE